MANNLAQRATAKRNAPATQNGDSSLTSQIRGMEKQFSLAMPKGAEATQLVRDALTCVRNTPKLAECDNASVLGALMTCAQLGLRPGTPLGHAYLLPLWNGRERRLNAQLIIGYAGLIELAHRSGQIKSLSARVVYENDDFEIQYGLHEDLIHRPAMSGDRGEPVAYYAVVHLVSGGYSFEVMSHDEMIAHRDKFAMAKTRDGKIVGPWRDHFESMAKKTMIRRLAKLMPKSTDFATAIAADDRVRVDLAPSGVMSGDHIEGEAVETDEAGDEQQHPSLEQLAEITAEAGVIDEQIIPWASNVVGRELGAMHELTGPERVAVYDAAVQMTREGDK